MFYKFTFGDELKAKDTCGSVSDLIGTIGIFYIALLFLALMFVGLETPELSQELFNLSWVGVALNLAR